MPNDDIKEDVEEEMKQGKFKIGDSVRIIAHTADVFDGNAIPEFHNKVGYVKDIYDDPPRNPSKWEYHVTFHTSSDGYNGFFFGEEDMVLADSPVDVFKDLLK